MKKKKELFIIVAGETPYLGLPEEKGDMKEDNNLPDLTTSLKEAKKLLKLWEDWDYEICGQDDPPMDFKIYKVVEVK